MTTTVYRVLGTPVHGTDAAARALGVRSFVRVMIAHREACGGAQ